MSISIDRGREGISIDEKVIKGDWEWCCNTERIFLPMEWWEHFFSIFRWIQLLHLCKQGYLAQSNRRNLQKCDHHQRKKNPAISFSSSLQFLPSLCRWNYNANPNSLPCYGLKGLLFLRFERISFKCLCCLAVCSWRRQNVCVWGQTRFEIITASSCGCKIGYLHI